tara:strand:- start:3049 stop:4137 length:1089 start_codon:yes stop_codon:yes gene_type:complete
MSYKARIEAYAGDIDAWNSQDYTTASGTAEQFIADGAKFILDLVAKATPDKLPLFTTHTTSNWSSYAFTLGGGAGGYMEYFTNVYLQHSDGTKYECTPISADMARQAADINSLHYAPAISPVYYVSNSKVTVLPALGTPSIDVVVTPRIDDIDIESVTAISPIPDSYDDILILYASGKIIGTKLSYYQDYYTLVETASPWYTAVELVKTNIASAKTYTDRLYDENVTYDGSNKDLAAVSDSLDKAALLLEHSSTFNSATNTDDISKSVTGWLADEDSEMANATLQAVQSELQIAQGYLQQQQQLQAQIGSYITNANANLSEMQARLTKDAQTYQWLLGQKQLINTELMQALAAKGLAGAPAQ